MIFEGKAGERQNKQKGDIHKLHHYIHITTIIIIILIINTTRPPLPRQFTICNSGFFGGLATQGINSQMWYYRIETEELAGGWLFLFSYTPYKEKASEDIELGLGIVVNRAWRNPEECGRCEKC